MVKTALISLWIGLVISGSAVASIDCVYTQVNDRRSSVQLQGRIQIAMNPRHVDRQTSISLCPVLFGGVTMEFESEMKRLRPSERWMPMGRPYILTVKYEKMPRGPLHVTMKMPEETGKAPGGRAIVFLRGSDKMVQAGEGFEPLGYVSPNDAGLYSFVMPMDRFKALPRMTEKRLPVLQATILLAAADEPVSRQSTASRQVQ